MSRVADRARCTAVCGGEGAKETWPCELPAAPGSDLCGLHRRYAAIKAGKVDRARLRAAIADAVLSGGDVAAAVAAYRENEARNP